MLSFKNSITSSSDHFCFLDIDDCKGNPCKNGGTCIDGEAKYTCSCKPGFNGDDCEKSKCIIIWIKAIDMEDL